MDLYNKGDYIGALKEWIILLEQNKDNIELIQSIEYPLFRIYNYCPHIVYPPEFLNWLNQEVSKGNSYAILTLGHFHNMGKAGFKKDKKLAFELFTKASEQQNLMATECVGYTYEDGIKGFIESNHSEEFRIRKQVADRGLLNACTGVGRMYKARTYGVTNYAESLRYLLIAADKKYPPAYCSLGISYECEMGVPKNYNEAIKYYKLAAEQEYPRAQYFLGEVYERGIGVEINMEEAIKWYELAANHHDPDAACRLGRMYYYEVTDKQNFKKAFHFFKIAAENDGKSARTFLSKMYMEGKYVEKNYLNAVECFCDDEEEILKRFINFQRTLEYQHFAKDVFAKWKNYGALEEENRRLKEQNEMLQIEVDYRPGGDGYNKAKEDAEQLFDSISKKENS